MERRVARGDLVRDLDELLAGVVDEGEAVVIEEAGEPVAVLIPVNSYKHLRRAQETGELDDGRREHIWRRSDERDEDAD